MPKSPAPFVGWRRYSWSQWLPLCSAQTLDECRRKLDQAGAVDPDGDGEQVVLPAGVDPIDKPIGGNT